MLDLLHDAIDQKYNSTGDILNSPSNSNKRQRRGLNEFSSPNNLKSKRIKLLRFDGTMTQIQRTSVIQTFQEDSSTQILLISLK